jgi:hypothetical protein
MFHRTRLHPANFSRREMPGEVCSSSRTLVEISPLTALARAPKSTLQRAAVARGEVETTTRIEFQETGRFPSRRRRNGHHPQVLSSHTLSRSEKFVS